MDKKRDAIAIVGTKILRQVVFYSFFICVAATSRAELTPGAQSNEPINMLSLMDAITHTLNLNPSIAIDSEVTAQLQGEAQSASGVFDASLDFILEYEFSQDELTPAELAREEGARLRERLFFENFKRVADRLDQTLATTEGRLPEQTDQDELETQAFESLLNILVASAKTDEEREEFAARQAELVAQNRLETQIIIENLRFQSDQAKDRLFKLGTVPYVVRTDDATLELGVNKPFRNGIVFGPRLIVTAEDRNFRGKPRNPVFGGTGELPLYRSIIGFTLDIPLGKGSGEVSAAAPEKSAKLVHQASLEDLQFTIKQSVLRSILAYWDLVANQQTLELIHESAKRQDQLIEIGQALIEGDLVAKAELARVQARQANVWANYYRQRQSIHSRIARLIQTIGLDPEKVTTTMRATDDFPTVADSTTIRQLESTALVEESSRLRHDYQSAKILQQSSKVLLDRARKDLYYRADLQFSFAYTSVHRHRQVGEGLEGALFGNQTGPSVMLTFKMDLPFSNNVAKGNAAQSLGAWHRSIIDAENLKRTIAIDVVDSFRTLLRSSEEVQHHISSVASYETILNADIEKLKNGTATYINTILTEERLTDAKLSLVSAKQFYAKALAQLRFDIGTLLNYEGETGEIRREDIVSIPSG